MKTADSVPLVHLEGMVPSHVVVSGEMAVRSKSVDVKSKSVGAHCLIAEVAIFTGCCGMVLPIVFRA